MRLPSLFRRRDKALAPVAQSRGSWYPIFESFPGAWQSNVVVDHDGVLANPALFACMTLIARDIAKLRVKLVTRTPGGVWTESTNPAFSPVLRKPNPFQSRLQFWEGYILSKLSRGNTYVLKERDGRRVVTGLYVLDPNRVVPLVADDGDVYYRLLADNIAGIGSEIVVPASEIIHDRFNCLFHPLVGLSPIFAAGVAATQGLRIQDHSATFFANQSRPGGILVAPGKIDEATAARLKAAFDANYSGAYAGRTAVVGDALKFESIAVNADDSQLVEQLRWTAEIVAAVFHVPPYKIGVGEMPTNNNVQALNIEYYSQALQGLIEEAEACLDDGLGLDGTTIGTEFDVDNLLRMDSQTQMLVLKDGVGAGILAPNEARARVDLGPVEGGATPYLQQQNFALSALAKRDAGDDPFGKAAPRAPALPPPPADESPDTGAAATAAAERVFRAEAIAALRRRMEVV
jgi:HK97 family phage portal protein